MSRFGEIVSSIWEPEIVSSLAQSSIKCSNNYFEDNVRLQTPLRLRRALVYASLFWVVDHDRSNPSRKYLVNGPACFQIVLRPLLSIKRLLDHFSYVAVYIHRYKLGSFQETHSAHAFKDFYAVIRGRSGSRSLRITSCLNRAIPLLYRVPFTVPG